MLANTIIKNNLSALLPLNSKVSCDTETPWSFGSKIINEMKRTSFYGLSGRIQFSKETGFRNNLTFLIVDKIKSSIDLVNFFLIEFYLINLLKYFYLKDWLLERQTIRK